MSTPTSNFESGALPGGGAAPAGLPDPNTLARLANAFFSALPGSAPDVAGAPGGSPLTEFAAAAPAVPSSTNPVPPGSPLAGPSGAGSGVPGLSVPQGKAPGANLLPSSPTHILSLGNRGPALLPHAQAQNGLPDQVVSTAPGYDSRYGGQALGVPEGAGARPAAANVERAAPTPGSSTYYFLDGAGVPTRSEIDTRTIGLPGAGFDPVIADLSPDVARYRTSPYAETGTFDSVKSTESRYFLEDRTRGNTAERVDPFAFEHEARSAHPAFDVNAIRRDFPILQERVNGRQLVWFDNAATTHKPQCVIDRLAYFYAHENSNIHRAAHALAGRATDAYETARETVRRFIGASSTEEIVFVRGTTEAINLVAKSWGAQNVGEGDEIIVSHLEHHANIVPWQQLAAEKGAKIRVIPVDDSGQVLLEEYKRLLNDRTKIVSVTQVSNALGTVVPVKDIVDLAHRAGALALVDGAQSVSHLAVDVQALDADFFVFSGHKIFGPTGIGVVYGKRAVLDAMPPWQGGGNMIADVTFERTVFQPPPNRFEAGTGNIADAVGLGAALDYVSRIGLANIARYEHELLEYATVRLGAIDGVRLVGTARDKASVLSFVLKGYTTEEVGKALNEEGIAVRTGHHCAQPILRRFGLETTVRPSLAFYNTTEEVDRMLAVVKQLARK
ncbi:family 2A encapsulin nanocompartment cargo protein cysteine desulfurase [Pararobbsia silviterrae]|uniref:cysteine desulfurase n=1 Tax=Pararobbsia silviterrae TaxID=1792498 RepID=A0A494XIN6_9BURK|nr:family 2A encapsulin nanocompartment cargo protein cysteine desulfurase [Pararobbsia silviterrae]RKP49622.1 cysteine desulfurase [Pararobbsia silviterrae]